MATARYSPLFTSASHLKRYIGGRGDGFVGFSYRFGPMVLSLLLFICVMVALRSRIFWSESNVVGTDLQRWQQYTLEEAAAAVAKDGTVIVCVVSYPYLAFLVNWLVGVARQGRQDSVLVIAEDYEMLHYVNRWWPGHAVLIPPALTFSNAQRFGSQGFFNFTSRRPQHLLKILDLGYSVLYNDVDMVWLADPFPLFVGSHDIYFTDDMVDVKPMHHSHALPPPGKKGRTYICSCMIYLRPTQPAKLVLHKWVEELHHQPWSPKAKSNDQPAFNWALNKTAYQVDMYLLPQQSFPSGGLYFRNSTWQKEASSSQGTLAIVHNNYITGFDKKIKRFRESGLWLLDDKINFNFGTLEIIRHYVHSSPHHR